MTGWSVAISLRSCRATSGRRTSTPCVGGASVIVSTDSPSKRRRAELPPQPLAYQDGRQIERDDDRQEQERRQVDHRLGRLDVGRLEPDVVDVEPEVHELPVE